MGVAVLNPQDCLNQPFSHMKYPRNHTPACPNRQKNRTRRSPPRNQTARSPPKAPPPPPPPQRAPAPVSSFVVPKGTVKKSPIAGKIRILKRGEEIPKKTADLVVVKTELVVEKPDLVSTQRIGPDPCLIPSQIRLSDRKPKKTVPPFYAGPVTMTSPPPSDVPLPAFFTTKKSVEATNHLIRILRLDIA